MKKRLLLLFVGWLVCSFGVGQNPVTGKLTLEEVFVPTRLSCCPRLI